MTDSVKPFSYCKEQCYFGKNKQYSSECDEYCEFAKTVKEKNNLEQKIEEEKTRKSQIYEEMIDLFHNETEYKHGERYVYFTIAEFGKIIELAKQLR